MSKLGALVRAGLKANFGLAVFLHRIFREKKDRWILPIFAFSLLGLVSMLYGFVVFISGAYSILKPMGQQQALAAMGITLGQVLLLIFGVYYVLSALYFARDIEMLIPLPVRPSEVLLSKFIVITISEYLTVALLVLPFLITYGVLDRSGLSYWIFSTLIYLALPILPLAAVTAAAVLMMRYINLSRKKDILILVGGVVVLAAAVGFQFLMQRSAAEEVTAQDMAVFLTAPDSLLNRIGAAFPPGLWAARAVVSGMTAKGLANLAAFLGTSLLALVGMYLLGERFFYKGVIGLAEKGVRKRTLSTEEMARRVSSGRRAVPLIFTRELRIMNRTPVFLLNGVIVVLIFHVLLPLYGRQGRIARRRSPKLLDSGNSLHFICFAPLFYGRLQQTQRHRIISLLSRRGAILDFQGHTGCAVRTDRRKIPSFLRDWSARHSCCGRGSEIPVGGSIPASRHGRRAGHDCNGSDDDNRYVY
jgi:ABC-2 type transport system permease protein